MLIKKQEFLETKIDQEIMTAKKNASKNKRGRSYDNLLTIIQGGD